MSGVKTEGMLSQTLHFSSSRNCKVDKCIGKIVYLLTQHMATSPLPLINGHTWH